MGRERPRRSPSGPRRRLSGGVAHAPSLFDTCAGALSGRHIAPPVLNALPNTNIVSFNEMQPLVDCYAGSVGSETDINGRRAKGANRALALRPPSRPLSSGRSRVLGRR